MWSPIEVCVDPREVITRLPAWLSKEYKVQFVFDCAATAYDDRRILAGGEEFAADNLYVCVGLFLLASLRLCVRFYLLSVPILCGFV